MRDTTRTLIKSLARRPHPIGARPWLHGSFSQTGEDRIIAFLFETLGVRHPRYLDIGAYHPYHFSNTALLYQRGSRGINVEPDPDSFARIQRRRRHDRNLNVGVGAEPGQLTFYRMNVPTLNTFSEESAQRAVEESKGRFRIVSTIEVEVRTVPDILEGTSVDFLSLDVEGLDLEVLRTMPSWPARPTVVCVETITYSESGRGEKVVEIGEEMSHRGYLTFADTHINTIFVLEDNWIR